MRAFLLIALLSLPAAGCNSSDAALAVGGPSAMLANMRGTGALKQRADGTQGFAWTIQADAFDGYVEKDKQEAQRGEMLAGWLGQQRACPKGYVIDKRTEIKSPLHAIYYEGHCKS